MFRRRTTDQVYATLQQVQRRITEQGAGATAAPPGGARPFAGMPPRQIPSTVLPLSPGSLPGSAPLPSQPMPGTAAAAYDDTASAAPPARGTLQLPIQVAVTLALLWLGTVGAAFFIGVRQGRSDDRPVEAAASATAAATTTTKDSATTVAAAATKPLDVETPTSGKRIGNSILVLTSVPSATDATRAEWQRLVDHYNNVMRQHADRGWKPWFGIRTPDSGGLQLAFGFADGAWGIERTSFEDLAKQLQRSRDQGGGGFTTAKWVTIE